MSFAAERGGETPPNLAMQEPAASSDAGTHDAGAAPVEVNHRRPSSANRGRERPKSTGHTLHWFAYIGRDPEFDLDDDSGGQHSMPHDPDSQDINSSDPARDASANAVKEREREERARMAREQQQSERQKKLEELREQALAAQRYRQQKEEERRRRIDEMRLRDTDRRLQVEERKRAILEAERERREAIVKRNEEREARLEGRKRPSNGPIFAFGSSTPRMLEPADTGGSFWGHRRATSTSNVMFAALPLSRRSSERELDPNKKRATSASGLDRQAGDEDGNTDGSAPWSRVARRRTDLVPTIPAPRESTPRCSTTPRPPGRAYSMSRLDQLAQPRRPRPLIPPPPPPPNQSSPPTRPPRHRSMGNLAAAAAHRSMGNLSSSAGPSPPPRKHLRPATTGSSIRSGEITPGSPSRPGSSMSSASTTGGIMTSSVAGAITVNRRPRAAPRRPRPASIAGTGVTTPPHVKNTIIGADGKTITIDKPPLPRVHSAGIANKKTPTVSQQSPIPADKPQAPRRTHKVTPQKSPRVTPKVTPLQSPATDLPPTLPDVTEATAQELVRERSNDTITLEESQLVETHETVTHETVTNGDVTTTITTEVKQVTKDGDDAVVETETIVTEVNSVDNGVDQSIDEIKDVKPSDDIAFDMNELKLDDKKDSQQMDPLDGADMTSSMMSRRITTEEEAKAALAERRRLAREEAERQAERERLRLEEEAAAEIERQRQEEERQRQLEEETIRLSELQRKAEEERLEQAIIEAQKTAEEEKARREEEAKAKAEKEAIEAKAREEAEKQRKENAQKLQREEQEREARRKRVQDIMSRTRLAQQKKDDEKSPSDETKGLDDLESKTDQSKPDDESADQKSVDKELEYEMSVRQREEDLFNQTATFVKQDAEPVTSNGINSFQNGTSATSNGSHLPSNDNSFVETNINHSNDYISQNGHSKNDISEMNIFLNNTDNQFTTMALDNPVKQTVSNNLLDISDINMMNTANSNNPFANGNLPSDQIIDVTTEITKNLVNEDSINSNNSFIASFQDNQENRDVSLL